MRCPSCNHDNPGDASFCEECGAKLELTCPACKASVSPGARFCKKCGAAIGPTKTAASTTVASPKSQILVAADGPASEAIDGERKTVTALFADLKGSTELMESLDPEEARAIVDPALKIMVDAVRRYEGYVVQSTGDGIFALFGAPAAYEDHPQRALYAALQMQQGLREYAQYVVGEGKHRLKPAALEARVGINTGEVVVRTVETGDKVEYTPIGHAANLASRLQTVAPAGSVVVSEPTRSLVEGYFELRALGPMPIRGISEPINVYEVTGLGPLRTHFQLSAWRGLTKFVGRERELEAMRQALELTMSARGQIVAVVADAGTGKSRLFYEFKATMPPKFKLLEAYSVSHGKASAWLPVLELLRGYFGIQDADDPVSRREKVRAGLKSLDPALSDALPYLWGLLGIQESPDPLAQTDPQIKRQRTLDAIKRILLRESLNQPTVIIFEDLHWIDSETQALLDLIADSIAGTRLLLLVNYRPEYRHEWAGRGHYLQLRLDPLSGENATAVLNGLLGDGAELDAPKRLIAQRTGGNPFFIEEMVQALFEQGILARNGAVKLVQPLARAHLLVTVQGVLAARIDRLTAQDKELLQTLAVIGNEIPVVLARQVSEREGEELQGGLANLRLSEFIFEQPSLSNVEYVFKHALTHEVAYNSLLIERRKLLHERAGQALESLFPEHLDDHLDKLARHYSHSDNVGKAVEYLERAAQQAIQRSANNDALSSLSAALNLLQKLPDGPERDRQELLLMLSRGSVLLLLDGWSAPEVERACNRAVELCQQLGEPPELFTALFGLWSVYHVRGEFRQARKLAERLLERAQSVHDPALLLSARYALAATLFQMGELVPARHHVETAISLYDFDRDRSLAFRHGGVDLRVSCLSYAGQILWLLGYVDQALDRANEAVAFAQPLSHPHSLVFAAFSCAFVHELRREMRETQEIIEGVVALSAEHGFTLWSAFSSMHHGYTVAEQGRHEEGMAELQQGKAASDALGAQIGRPLNFNQIAQLCLETARFTEGLDASAHALAIAEQHEDRSCESETHRLKGELLLKQNESNAAEVQTCFERAIEVASRQSAKSWELRATMSLARLLAKQGRRDEARAMLEEIYNWVH
jgi:class 3 adenylate cyclase/predicted ATPase